MRRLAALVLAAVSCAPANPCAATCAGCCAPDGTCLQGDVPLACGSSGASCRTCSAGDLCNAGLCLSTSGTGGGSGTAGGSAGSGGQGGSGPRFGTRAWIRPSELISADTSAFENELKNAGAGAVDVNTVLPTSNLDAYRLIVFLPGGPPETGLGQTLREWMFRGGRVVVVADRAGIGADAAANELLVALDAAVRVMPDDLAPGCHLAVVNGSHPLVAGASSINYSWGSRITGGTTLYTMGGDPVAAAERNVVLVSDTAPFMDVGCGTGGSASFIRNLWNVLTVP